MDESRYSYAVLEVGAWETIKDISLFSPREAFNALSNVFRDPLDKPRAKHFLIDNSTLTATEFDPKEISLEQVKWVNENFTVERLGIDTSQKPLLAHGLKAEGTYRFAPLKSFKSPRIYDREEYPDTFGIGPESDISYEDLKQYLKENEVPVDPYRERFDIGGAKYQPIEIDGKNYVVNADYLQTKPNPEYEGFPHPPKEVYSPGWRLYYAYLASTPEELRTQPSRGIDALAENSNIREGGPFGTYYEVNHVMRVVESFKTGKIFNGQAYLAHVRDTLDERGIEYPKELLGSGQNASREDPAAPQQQQEEPVQPSFHEQLRPPRLYQ